MANPKPRASPSLARLAPAGAKEVEIREALRRTGATAQDITQTYQSVIAITEMLIWRIERFGDGRPADALRLRVSRERIASLSVEIDRVASQFPENP